MRRRANADRDAEIVQLAKSGMLLAVIGQQFNLSADHVRHIVNQEAARLRRVALDKANGKNDAVKAAIRTEVFRGK